jgi:hypothetical protein
MEYVLEYPRSNLSWFRLFTEPIRIWWMKNEIRNFRENDLLIN